MASMIASDLYQTYLCKLENNNRCQYRYYQTDEIQNIGRFTLKKEKLKMANCPVKKFIGLSIKYFIGCHVYLL